MSASPLRRDLLVGTAISAAVSSGAAFAHSLRKRGPRATAVFVGLGIGLPALAEWRSINRLGELRHHTGPQVANVPLPALGGWYSITSASASLADSLLCRLGLSAQKRRWATPLASALLATSLDLIMDPFCLNQGLWEWRDGGPYAPEIAGPNGRQGIPLANYGYWLGLTGGVTALEQWLSGEDAQQSVERVQPTERATAALLLSYYLPAAAWAVWRRQLRYLLYSALVPLATVAGLLDRARD